MNQLTLLFLLVSRLENCSGNDKSYQFPLKIPLLTQHPSVQVSCPTVQSKVQPITDHEGPERQQRYRFTLSLPSALDGVGGQCHAPAALHSGKPGTHCTGGWVGPRAGLDVWGKSRLPRIRSPKHPARSKSLYRPRYPGLPCLIVRGLELQ